MSWGQQKHCTLAIAFSESFVGARSSISWCLMRDLLIILNPEGDPRFASFIFSLFVHIFAGMSTSKWQRNITFLCALQFSRLTVNITLHTVRGIAKIQSILSSLGRRLIFLILTILLDMHLKISFFISFISLSVLCAHIHMNG